MYVLIHDASHKPAGTLRFVGSQDEFCLSEINELSGPNEHGTAYEVIDSNGALPSNGGFAVFNNIPVTTDGRLEFENRFNNRARMVDDEPGFRAIRILRPLHGDTYIVLTVWSSEEDFKAWQQSQAYGPHIGNGERAKASMSNARRSSPPFLCDYV